MKLPWQGVRNPISDALLRSRSVTRGGQFRLDTISTVHHD
jgi:hypothetical protein